MVIKDICGTSITYDEKILPKWDKIKDGFLKRKDEDRVFIVDGKERSGKSTYAIQQAAYIDPTIIEGNLNRICFDVDEFLSAIRNTRSTEKETKCVIFDEAFRGLSSRAVMSKTNKKIIQALMEMGQNNLVVFIVLPSFFLLDIYPAMLRSDVLFHVYKDKHGRRGFRVFNYRKKALLYRLSTKQGWNYKVNTRFHGRFSRLFPGGEDIKEKYLKKKQDSFIERGKELLPEVEENRISLERRIFCMALFNYLKSKYKLEREGFVNLLKPVGIDLDPTSLSHYSKDLKKLGKNLIIEEKGSELVGKCSNVSENEVKMANEK